mgnify:FL=1
MRLFSFVTDEANHNETLIYTYSREVDFWFSVVRNTPKNIMGTFHGIFSFLTFGRVEVGVGGGDFGVGKADSHPIP